MSGGIYVNKPFALNMKCVIFGVILIASYFMTSCDPNYFIPFLIFIVAYIAMAWYDYMYDCKINLYPANMSLPQTTAERRS